MYVMAWPAAIWSNNLLAADSSSADLVQMDYFPAAFPVLLASAGMLGLVADVYKRQAGKDDFRAACFREHFHHVEAHAVADAVVFIRHAFAGGCLLYTSRCVEETGQNLPLVLT